MDNDAMPKRRVSNRSTKGKAPETYNTDRDVETMRNPQKVVLELLLLAVESAEPQRKSHHYKRS